MNYIVTLSESSLNTLRKWHKSNPKALKKTGLILHELAEHPRTGLGHPETLKGKCGITWSRHITAHDRIIYDIKDTVVTVEVIEIGGHYDDK